MQKPSGFLHSIIIQLHGSFSGQKSSGVFKLAAVIYIHCCYNSSLIACVNVAQLDLSRLSPRRIENQVPVIAGLRHMKLS